MNILIGGELITRDAKICYRVNA